MEQKMRIGLVWGRLAVLKKQFGADYGQLWWAVFSCFKGQKKINSFKKYIIRAKKLHNIFFIIY